MVDDDAEASSGRLRQPPARVAGHLTGELAQTEADERKVGLLMAGVTEREAA